MIDNINGLAINQTQGSLVPPQGPSWRRKQPPTPAFCLENPRDGGVWSAAVYRVAQSWRWLKRLSSSGSDLYKKIKFEETLLLLLLSRFSRVWHCDPIDGSPLGSSVPGILQGHFLLQCMKVKSESEVTQSCPTLSDPMNCTYQAPLSMGFSRQEYWSGLPLPSPIVMLNNPKQAYLINNLNSL